MNCSYNAVPNRIIGLVGGYASGKSSVAQLFAAHGYTVLDVDKIGHETLLTEQEKIVAAFGETILSVDGSTLSIDRKKLGSLVFDSVELLDRLNKIMHPSMKKKVEHLCKAYYPSPVLIDAAMLFTIELDSLCEYIIGVRTSAELAIRRGIQRDGRTKEEIVAILEKQKKMNHLILNHADTIIENTSSLDDLTCRVLNLLRQLKETPT